ncbi:MAG: hypothetical protein JRF41_14130 [Deltaproteobacteria bacterium]|nr:hypothetical protein [Deltaproteobacteria bacterium]MBW2324622.1 hypothetical protein [Deltaproteobacteria bacterium]
MIQRFKGPFRIDSITQFLSCPRAFYFNEVKFLPPERINLNWLAARAGHTVISQAHREQNFSADNMFERFLDLFEKQKARVKTETFGAVDFEEYRSMLKGYANMPYNREAVVLALDSEFYFDIRPARTTYFFEGRIEQLLRIETDLLRAEFSDVFESVTKSSTILHRCLKFGQRRHTSSFELAMNVRLDILSLALKNGIFNHPPGSIDHVSRNTPYHWDIIPDFHAVYFLRDHIPYKDDGGRYLRDDNGDFIPCDLVSSPCLVGKKQDPCKGKRIYCTKKSRGPAMFFTARPQARIHAIPRELMPLCAAIRMGHYPRQLGELCLNYCGYRSACESEIRQRA